MSEIKSIRGLVKRFEAAPEEVQKYFAHLPKLLNEFPLEVSLSYVFSQVELAQNMSLYCAIVKLHRADANLARQAVDIHHMTREEFKEKFEIVFGRKMPKDIADILSKAEDVRDKVMHGKKTTESEKRQAIGHVLDYAEKLNQKVHGLAGFKPFADLRGFKGAAKSLDKATTRWILKGMEFNMG